MSKSLDELYNELDDAFKDFIDDQRRMMNLSDALKIAIRKTALQHYPEIENLEKEGFVRLMNYEGNMINNSPYAEE